jgi:hypothetical protein
VKAAVIWTLALVGVVSLAFATSAPAGAAGLVAKDGKIHACYKAKGKGKGTLRVVRSAKAKCPKKWRKVAWGAAALPGPRGETGAIGATGEKGEKGTAGVVVVEELESKVGELLTRVESLEAILKGVTNAELKEAIAAVANVAALEATVTSLCAQTSTLTDQVNAVEEALGGLSLNTLLAVVLEIPPLPGALPSYSCP